MIKRFLNKNVVITGCNRGIGRSILEMFVKEGANIIACVRSESIEVKSDFKSLEQKYNIKIYILHIDLEDENSVRTCLREIAYLKLPIDILVNNAGIESGGLLMFTKMSELHKVFQVNLFAQIQITQYIAKLMMKQQHGCIIMMGSILGLTAYKGCTTYGTSKAALSFFSKIAADELSDYGIRVNTVAPNVVNTSMGNKISKKTLDTIMTDSFSRRIAETNEIASVVLFLASDESSYINGQIIRVDGGLR